jgi:hypothetical protein
MSRLLVFWAAGGCDTNCNPLNALRLGASEFVTVPRSVLSKVLNCSSRRGVDRIMITLNVIPVAWSVYTERSGSGSLGGEWTYRVGQRVEGIAVADAHNKGQKDQGAIR